jgi:hypothetical protein
MVVWDMHVTDNEDSLIHTIIACTFFFAFCKAYSFSNKTIIT